MSPARVAPRLEESLPAGPIVRGEQAEHLRPDVVLGTRPLQVRRPLASGEAANGLEVLGGFLRKLRSHETTAGSIEWARASYVVSLSCLRSQARARR